jgi:hypothetical protein
VLYILVHTHFSIRRRLGKVDDPGSTITQPVYIGVRYCGFIALLWLISSGWSIIVTVKSPICNLRDGSNLPVLLSCSGQKAGTALSVILL